MPDLFCYAENTLSLQFFLFSKNLFPNRENGTGTIFQSLYVLIPDPIFHPFGKRTQTLNLSPPLDRKLLLIICKIRVRAQKLVSLSDPKTTLFAINAQAQVVFLTGTDLAGIEHAPDITVESKQYRPIVIELTTGQRRA